MMDSKKNRCPDAAKKRAVADARCALRKLELLSRIEAWKSGAQAWNTEDDAHTLLAAIAEALGVKS